MLTLTFMLDQTVRLYGQRTAIRDSERNFTWIEFADRVARAAGVLHSLGLRRGERFGIMSRNSFRFAELNYAGYRMGAVPVPINYRLAPPEIESILDDAECRLLAVDDAFRDFIESDELSPWRERMFWVCAAAMDTEEAQYEKLLAESDAVPAAECDENDDAVLMYTGGTTGRGKGVRLTHRNIVSNAMQLSQIMGVSADDVYLHSSPMFHSTDLKSTVITMVGGGHTYLAEVSPRSVLEAIERHQVTVASLVPTMIIRIIEDGVFDSYDISSLRLLSYGTSPIAVKWIQRAMQGFKGVGLHQCYGLTETSPILTVLDEDDHSHAIVSGDHTRLSAAGRPLADVELRIVDEAGREVPVGEVGEILVRAPNVAKGYHNRPDEDAATFRDGWLHTGDVGRMDREGYLYVVDRKKEMVLTGGENVYTSEVEAVLFQHPEIHEAAVVGVPDHEYGEALFAVIVPAPGKSLTEDEVIAHCRGKIGGYKIPRRMAFVDELPKSTMGKVLKDDLRRIYAEI